MATCAALSVADEALHATTENEHFQRLCQLLMRGGVTLLMEVFDSIHPPANLTPKLSKPTIKAKLQKLRKDKILSQAEWDRLYPPTGMPVKSADFDISLLFKLLRNICSLTPPATGWDKKPNNTAHSLEADLARIKYYRNSLYGHNQKMEIIDADFVNLWTEISEALLRIASSLSSAKRVEWKESIDKLRHDPLTPDAQQHVAELRTQCKEDMEIKDEVEKVNIKLDQQTNIFMEQINILREQMNIKLDQQTNILMEEINIKHGEAITHICTIVESIKPCGSSSCPHCPGPSHAEFERAAGSSATSDIQQNQPPDFGIWQVILSFQSSFTLLIKYLGIKLRVYVQTSHLQSLGITVSCNSLQVLEGLWKDYCSGHLNEVIQETLVTAEVLKELNLSEVKLKTIISEEEYKACKELLTQRSAPQHQSAPEEPSGASTLGPSAAPQYQAPSPEAATPGPSGRKKMEFLPAAASVKLGGEEMELPLPAAASVAHGLFLSDIPLDLEDLLVKRLDVRRTGERLHGWRKVGTEFGIEQDDLNYLENAYKKDGGSPAKELLDLLDCQGRNAADLVKVLNSPRVNCPDIALLIQQYMDNSTSSPVLVTAELHEKHARAPLHSCLIL